MSDNLTYLFVAFLVTWLVIGGYVWMLGRQVQSLRDEVAALEAEEGELEAEGGQRRLAGERPLEPSRQP